VFGYFNKDHIKRDIAKYLNINSSEENSDEKKQELLVARPKRMSSYNRRFSMKIKPVVFGSDKVLVCVTNDADLKNFIKDTNVKNFL